MAWLMERERGSHWPSLLCSPPPIHYNVWKPLMASRLVELCPKVVRSVWLFIMLPSGVLTSQPTYPFHFVFLYYNWWLMQISIFLFQWKGEYFKHFCLLWVNKAVKWMACMSVIFPILQMEVNLVFLWVLFCRDTVAKYFQPRGPPFMQNLPFRGSIQYFIQLGHHNLLWHESEHLLCQQAKQQVQLTWPSSAKDALGSWVTSLIDPTWNESHAPSYLEIFSDFFDSRCSTEWWRSKGKVSYRLGWGVQLKRYVDLKFWINYLIGCAPF